MNFRSARRLTVGLLLSAAVVGGVTRALVLAQTAAPPAAGTANTGPSAATPPPGSASLPTPPPANAVPISAALVLRQDVPLWLRGLGSVQAWQSVQLRSRVDGTLIRVPVTEGQEVKQGDLLAVIDPRPYQALVDAVVAKKHQDEAQLVAARSDLKRYSSLAASEVASKQKLETTEALVGQLLASIAADDAQIDAAKLNLAFCYITAPFDGRVGLRTIDPGNFVRSAEVTPVLPLAQLKPIAVVFTVPQDNLPAIQKAMAAGKPRVVAFASNNTDELGQGQLLTLDNAIDPTTGTIRLKAIFPNDNQRLWPGQFVNTRLLLATTPGALTVPSVAVRHGQDGLFVFVVKPDQTVFRQTVEVARDDGVTAVVSKGLTEGQQVVTDGHSRLQSGSRVAIITPSAGGPKPGVAPSNPGG